VGAQEYRIMVSFESNNFRFPTLYLQIRTRTLSVQSSGDKKGEMILDLVQQNSRKMAVVKWGVSG